MSLKTDVRELISDFDEDDEKERIQNVWKNK